MERISQNLFCFPEVQLRPSCANLSPDCVTQLTAGYVLLVTAYTTSFIWYSGFCPSVRPSVLDYTWTCFEMILPHQAYSVRSYFTYPIFSLLHSPLLLCVSWDLLSWDLSTDTPFSGKPSSVLSIHCKLSPRLTIRLCISHLMPSSPFRGESLEIRSLSFPKA